MEANVYICDKKKKLGRYYLELQENRDIKALGFSLEDCREEIAIQIMDWNGDMQAVVEFIPEKSKKMKTGVLLYSSLGYNESVDISNKKELYTDGYCSKCFYPLGKRNNILINIESEPKTMVAIIRSMGRTGITMYSNNFIDLLNNQEKDLFIINEVLCKGETSNYVELIPKRIIKQCGHIGAEYPTTFTQSWKCSKCGREEFITKALSYKYNYNHIFLDLKTIRNNPTMFFLNHGRLTSLIVRNDRWQELLKYKKETKGITTDPVVVLESKYVEYPELEEPKKFEW